MSRIDEHVGKSAGGGFIRGAGIGAGVGAVAGLLVGVFASSGCDEFLCEFGALSYAGSFGLGGAAVGGLIGTAVPVDRWSRLDLPEERGFAEPQRDSHLGTILLLTGSLLLIAAGS